MSIAKATEYRDLKVRAWKFTKKFSGRAGFSLGDARAYLSALVDIAVVELGADYVTALGEAIMHAERVYASWGYAGVVEDYARVYKRWLGLDRSKLSTKQPLPGGAPPSPEPEIEMGEELVVASLFTGAYGLDLGFELAGFKTAVALDISEDSYKNLRANRPKIPFLLGDIKRFSTYDILKEAGLKPGEVDVVTGGPPCQPFSPAGRRQSLSDPRAAPLAEFIRVVKEAKPKVFVMEEVPGILSARIRHVPLRERGSKRLMPEEEPGSAWRAIVAELQKTGYKVAWKVLNAADYGAPQIRERVIVIGVRPDIGRPPVFPRPTHSGDPGGLAGPQDPWLTLAEAVVGIGDHVGWVELPPKYARFMRYVPPGGNWRQLPDELKPEAMNGAYNAGGGRMGFYRRLTWFEPSPTLVTHPAMKATMMVHPWEDRPLSVREYLRIQGFPDSWKVVVPAESAYRLFGEAVPVHLAKAVAEAVRDKILMSKQNKL
ncbi:DNA cytosine methyltransferase [Pyrobaculum sp.]|uniref:DNA cytosine methyltransferase n=1 Tax=Pyrobaculum sp. TaxID=2004705 RepID=UPI003164A6C5